MEPVVIVEVREAGPEPTLHHGKAESSNELFDLATEFGEW
jgi:hypothetical protein